jgi:hypothetical protein
VGPRGGYSRVIWVEYVQPPVRSTTSEAGGSRGPTAAQPAHNRSEQDATGLRHVRRKKMHEGGKNATNSKKNSKKPQKTQKKHPKTQKKEKNICRPQKNRFYPYPISCDAITRGQPGRGREAYSAALLALQLIAVCHTGDRIPGRSLGNLQRRINILGLRQGARGREDCFLYPIACPKSR